MYFDQNSRIHSTPGSKIKTAICFKFTKSSQVHSIQLHVHLDSIDPLCTTVLNYYEFAAFSVYCKNRLESLAKRFAKVNQSVHEGMFGTTLFTPQAVGRTQQTSWFDTKLKMRKTLFSPNLLLNHIITSNREHSRRT